MTLDYRLDDGAQALDQQQQLDFRRGYQVIDAASGSNLVTAASSGLAVDVAAGDINAGGTTVSCAANSDVSLTAADPDQPRVDVVYRDPSGNVQVKDGVPDTAAPGGGRDRDAYQPAPYDMHDIDGVVLATVWVAAGATALSGQDIRDRRLPASLDVDSLQANSVETVETHTESIGANSVHYAGDFTGSDPDARLDNALSKAGAGDCIVLENAVYDSARTISTGVRIRGPGRPNACSIEADLTLSAKGIHLEYAKISSTVTLSGQEITVKSCKAFNGSFQVDSDKCKLSDLLFGSVTFASDTSAGLIDSSSQVNVTDNGTNTVGDIA